MTIGSLFSGIGGLELGLERAGLGPVLWQAESDQYCRGALAHHWPSAKRYEDVREVGENAQRVDIICGGFPCQDISVAGSGAGLAGARSGLWSEYVRIVGELRPRFVVVENVSALLGRGLGDVLGDLAALGYDAWWDCIPAAAIGAPHRRDRLFVVAWRVSDAQRDGVRHEPERGAGAAPAADCGNAKPEHVGEAVANRDSGRCQGERLACEPRGTGQQSKRGHELDGCDLPKWPPAPDDMHAWGRVQTYAQPAVCCVAHGIPDRVARLRALGNAVVPQVAEMIGGVVRELMRSKAA